MTVKEMTDALNLRAFTAEEGMENNRRGYTSDLLSDVMGYADADSYGLPCKPTRTSWP